MSAWQMTHRAATADGVGKSLTAAAVACVSTADLVLYRSQRSSSDLTLSALGRSTWSARARDGRATRDRTRCKRWGVGSEGPQSSHQTLSTPSSG
eukprot:209983-Prymnesium_polylepis.1